MPLDVMTMKRFAIFGGKDFYPTGGFLDLIGTAETQAEAERDVKWLVHHFASKGEDIEWWQVVDLSDGQIVAHHYPEGGLRAASVNIPEPFNIAYDSTTGTLTRTDYNRPE